MSFGYYGSLLVLGGNGFAVVVVCSGDEGSNLVGWVLGSVGGNGGEL